LENKLIYALEARNLESAQAWVEKLKDVVSVFKIGKQLFTKEGPDSVRVIHESGARTFLDLKFHDIPSTVREAGYEAAMLGVFMFNVHAAGGTAMMQAAKEGALRAAEELGRKPPLVLAVTVLTSLSDQDMPELGMADEKVRDQVIRLARLAKGAGLDGVVASPQEVEDLRREFGKEFLIVTPGVRPGHAEAIDQKRIMTPGEAVRKGADYIVVGRPIRESQDPVAAARAILEEIRAAETE
jgi:orotidine-5'-phosphate decarboxylase